VLKLPSHQIVARGVGYVPQGRRVWPSLSVDEHLRIALRGKNGDWSIDRVYELFPRLHERRRNGGGQLSGGEQQMLAIGRALLGNPKLLIMDEPTEGLAPVIVEQVALTLKQLADEDEISVLLIEQNLGVATDVSDRVAVLVNGRIARELSAAELAADLELQQRLLGVSSQETGDEQENITADSPEPPDQVFQVVRRSAGPATATATAAPAAANPPVYTAAAAPTRWSQGNPLSRLTLSRQLTPASTQPEAESASAPPVACAICIVIGEPRIRLIGTLIAA
jgi:ABC-type branched-subunit amino acid transport system ATPase component